MPILRGTRVQADCIVENYEDGSPVEEISENFAIPETVIRELLTLRHRSDGTFGLEGWNDATLNTASAFELSSELYLVRSVPLTWRRGR